MRLVSCNLFPNVATYTFRCRSCLRRMEVVATVASGPGGAPDCRCESPNVVRDYRAEGFRITRGDLGYEHFNSSVGSYVRNQREFSEGLKRKSEEASVLTGISHDFKPFDGDRASAGVSEKAPELAARRDERLGRFNRKMYL